MQDILNEGVKTANFEYSLPIFGLTDKDKAGISVSSNIESPKRGQIISKGKNVAYVEYGVGLYAQGSYEGGEAKLPKGTITFESPKGHPQHTNGWQYFYDNPLTKTTIGGQKGWFIGNGIFKTGHIAGSQMFRTGQKLRANMPAIAKATLKTKGR